MGFLALSCKGPQGKDAEVSKAENVQSTLSDVDYELLTSESQVKWVGAKPGGEHFGRVFFHSGSLNMLEEKLSGGQFVIDMEAILVDDIEDAGMNKKLVQHLKSTDFFHVDSFKVATFQITRVEPAVENKKFGSIVSGNLTIKGITKNISFPVKVEVDGDIIYAQSDRFVIDRTLWEVNYQSKKVFANLKDKFIHDDIAIEVRIAAKRLNN